MIHAREAIAIMPRDRKPTLSPRMTAADFVAYYWLQKELVGFARVLGLPTSGNKLELSRRIERWLEGRRVPPANKRASSGPRDSKRRLTRRTRVVHYRSDDATRAFFESQIGPGFHFTYRLNQFRLARTGLTYGDLVDEWLAERDRRRRDGYQAPIASHGKYNRFIRAYFADPKHAGKTLADAAAAWNVVKHRRQQRT